MFPYKVSVRGLWHSSCPAISLSTLSCVEMHHMYLFLFFFFPSGTMLLVVVCWFVFFFLCFCLFFYLTHLCLHFIIHLFWRRDRLNERYYPSTLKQNIQPSAVHKLMIRKYDTINSRNALVVIRKHHSDLSFFLSYFLVSADVHLRLLFFLGVTKNLL